MPTNTITGSVSTLSFLSRYTITNLGTVGGTVAVYFLGFTDTLINSAVVAGSTATSSGTGARFANDGAVTNQSSGTISGAQGIFIAGAGTVSNAGQIAGGSTPTAAGPNKGVYVLGGGVITNLSSGSITGFSGAEGGFGVTISNAGHIAGGNTITLGFAGRGVYLVNSGLLTNLSSGSISGFTGAVLVSASLSNAGSIVGNYGSNAGTNGLGVHLIGANTVTNQSSGRIAGFGGIKSSGGASTVVNAGTIVGSTASSLGYGIDVYGAGVLKGATIANQAGGWIGGYTGILASYGGTTVVNAGTIAGTKFAVNLVSGYTNRVIIDPGAVFTGTVSGGNTIGAAKISTLELASGASAATLSGLNTKYIDFAHITVDSAATWTLYSGTSTIVTNQTLINAGTLTGPTAVSSGRGVILGGGSLTNQSGGTIAAYDGVYSSVASGAVVNAGLIAGVKTASHGRGVYLKASGTITNQGGASIVASQAIYIGPTGPTLADVTVVNAGVIAGNTTTATGRGIYQAEAGLLLVTNQSGGTIGGLQAIAGIAMTVVNAGTIAGNGTVIGGAGVYLHSPSSVTNQSGGTIAGFDGIQSPGGPGTVFNAGTIAGNTSASGGTGIDFSTGTITNQAGGSITGYRGIYGFGAITVVNAGVIAGTSYAVRFHAGSTDRLVVDPGAVFTGTVSGGNTIGAATVSTLELASGASTGTLSGLGTQFVDFSQIAVDSAATWTLSGTNSLATGVTLTNAGTLTDTGTATLGSVLGTGSLIIGAGATLTAQTSIASSQMITFAGTAGLLALSTPSLDSASILGFRGADTIDLAGVVAGSVTYSSAGGGVLNFSWAAGGTGSIATPGASAVTSVSDGHGGALVFAVCFCAGTRIATPAGERPVETLRPGDMVLTAGGAVRPLVWIGTGQVMVARGHRSAATPVILRKGAFGPNVPNSDLRVTKGHSFYLDEALIPAEFLVNHRSILWDDHAQDVTIYHLELESHDILLANGAPAESYRDDGNRWLFQNGHSGWDLPPQEPCAPVLTGGPVVDAVWKRLLDRSGPRGLPVLTDDPDLHLIVDGQRIDASGRRGNAWTFALPERPERVRIVSRDGVPMELGIARDARSLGVAVRGIALLQGASFEAIAAADPRLSDGFHDYEAADDLRWTDGDAAIPATAFARFNDGGVAVVLTLGGTTHYLDDGARLVA